QPAKHERGQRIANHRFVVNRQQLFADNVGDRKKPAAGAARKNDCFLHPEISKESRNAGISNNLLFFSCFLAFLRDLIQEKRTSLPGSISKSRLSASAVFGLMISSMNFTKMGSSRKMA